MSFVVSNACHGGHKLLTSEVGKKKKKLDMWSEEKLKKVQP